MAFRDVRLPADVRGSLLLDAMPGRFEPWRHFELQARERALDAVVCLTPRAEIAQLSPSYHRALDAGTLPFRWVHLPVPNFGVPDDAANFRRQVLAIAQHLRDGQAVLLHCAAGMGRTGTAAACVLKALGCDADEALRRVAEAGSNPQNARQSGLVGWF
jgi:predicted protein tyrosine phosphatase